MIERLKSGLMPAVAWLLGCFRRLSSRAVGLVLVYHRVADPQESRQLLSPALGTELFEAQLRHLQRRYRVVPARELLDAVRTRRRGQRIPIAISFDDDLRSHLTAAMPILLQRGVPATFFLTGASLSGPFAFWWERLRLASDRGLVSEGELRSWLGPEAPVGARTGLRDAAAAIEAIPPARRDELAERLLERLGSDPPESGLRADEVRAIVSSGFEVGFHTRRHDPLPALSDERLAVAIVEGREELAAAAGSEISLIAYPHGKADSRVAGAAGAAGYRFGFTGAGGPVTGECDPMLLPRRSVSYHSAAHFALQLVRTLAQAPAALGAEGRGNPAQP